MFSVRCEIASLWHPAVHHSLLLLRALQQRHTLVLDPTHSDSSFPDAFWRISQYANRLSIICPDGISSSSSSSRSPPEGDEGVTRDPVLRISEGGLQRVHSPQHILHFFSLSPSCLKQNLPGYLDAAVVSDELLQAADDVLVTLSTGDMEAIRQTHSNLMNLVGHLDASLEEDDNEALQGAETWSTWPIFSLLKFLVEEAGVLLGPFPCMEKAYSRMQASRSVVAHTRFVNRTVELALQRDVHVAQLPAWPHRGFLREVQRQLADYTADPAGRMMEGVTGEKGPLRARVGCSVCKEGMSRNGELCLKKVIVSYCPSRGSPNMRQFLATHLPRFHAKYPSVTIDIRPRLWAEAGITGVYRDGSERSCKTKYMSPMGIWVRLHGLVNTANDYDQPFSASHLHFQRRSIQGTWNPWLWHYETERRRKEVPQWHRKLSEQEWDYYVDQYSAQMKQEEEAIQQRVTEYTDIPGQSTKEVQERWKQHVMPQLQTDMEFNLAHLRRQHTRGQRQKPVTMGEYKLFSVPDHREIGQDAVDMMRRREAKYLNEWWQKRKTQLKPPK